MWNKTHQDPVRYEFGKQDGDRELGILSEIELDMLIEEAAQRNT